MSRTWQSAAKLNAALLAAAANRRGSRIGSRKVAAGDGRVGAGPLESDFHGIEEASGVRRPLPCATRFSNATICGCGEQGRIQLVRSARPRHQARLRMGQGRCGRCWIRRGNVEEHGNRRSDGVKPARGHPGKRRHRDMHPSREPYLGLDDVRPGTFIAAVGADIRKRAKFIRVDGAGTVVADILAQCATWAICTTPSGRAMTPEAVHASSGIWSSAAARPVGGG